MNTYIDRTLGPVIESELETNKIIILYGPRQSGKTTLAKKILKNKNNSLYLLCEIPAVNEILSSHSLSRIAELFGDAEYIVLDEAQTVADIGRTLKLLADLRPELKIIATGSSSFELANKIVEPLTGRKIEHILYPLSAQEVIASAGVADYYEQLETRLQYGNYPAIVNSSKNREALLLNELSTSYLFKDILVYKDIRNSDVLFKLLQMLALQIGSEVSYTELSNLLNIDQQTVQKYIDLLEKIFVIYRIGPFSRNLRKELNKKHKIYFYDLGIRNALIKNFNQMSIRNDKGAMWENYCITERKKMLSNNNIFVNHYFWRTWDKKEIDLVEEANAKLDGYEIKWGGKIPKAPKDWLTTYENASYSIVNMENHLGFIKSPIFK